jgi:hypothetical protein
VAVPAEAFKEIKIMKKIKNPNEIVNALVSDYQGIFGDDLISIIMYGSAVTHEYKPGKSDINIAVVLTDNSISQISKSITLQKKWVKSGVSTPFFMSMQYIQNSRDTYPIEFLDMRSNYRVLFGEDIFENFEVKHEHVRLQCERELRGVAIHLRRSFVQCAGNNKLLSELLNASIRRLIPVFKGLLVLKDRSIPKSRSDIVSMVEDSYNLGASALSEVFNSMNKKLDNYNQLFDTYAHDVDKLIMCVDTLVKEEKE